MSTTVAADDHARRVDAASSRGAVPAGGRDPTPLQRNQSLAVCLSVKPGVNSGRHSADLPLPCAWRTPRHRPKEFESRTRHTWREKEEARSVSSSSYSGLDPQDKGAQSHISSPGSATCLPTGAHGCYSMVSGGGPSYEWPLSFVRARQLPV